jgi:hypothetical protein
LRQPGRAKERQARRAARSLKYRKGGVLSVIGPSLQFSTCTLSSSGHCIILVLLATTNITKDLSVTMVRVTAAELLDRYSEKHNAGHRAEAEEEMKIRKLFAARSAHLPGNNWCQDWIQWMKNNHPLLGLCCRNRLNPVGVGPRLVILISSISFGLIATNLVYLFYRTHPEANDQLVNIEVHGGKFEVTYETIMLLTLGGLLHSLADLGMWHLTACACCINTCFAKAGPYVAICISAVLCAASTLAVLWRATYEIRVIEESTANDIAGEENINWMDMKNVESFQFLASYFLELAFGKFTNAFSIITYQNKTRTRPCNKMNPTVMLIFVHYVYTYV